MLKRINAAYFVIGSILYLSIIPTVADNNVGIYAINTVMFLSYFILINISTNYFTINKKIIYLIVLLYSSLFVIWLNIESYYSTGDYFVFSSIDALLYDQLASDTKSMGFFATIGYSLKYLKTDDLGMLFILRSMYFILESNLLFNFLNIVIGASTAVILFKLSKQFMDNKYALVCSTSFSASSFMIWFYSSGLKEGIMIFIIVIATERYMRYRDNAKIINLIIFHLSALSLIFFRPAITLFIYSSIVLGNFLNRENSVKKISLFVVVLIAIVVLYPIINPYVARFVGGGSFEYMIYQRESTGQIVGSLPLTYSVNFLAQIIGPLPTIIPKESPLAFYGPGLILRVLLGLPFWLGIYHIMKNGINRLYPLLFFAILEMLSLSLILEGLELRKAIPHFPFVFIISFWFMYNYKDKVKSVLLYSYFTFAIIILVLWNYR